MKTALITGGAARIGAQIVKTLHHNQFNIIGLQLRRAAPRGGPTPPGGARPGAHGGARALRVATALAARA